MSGDLFLVALQMAAVAVAALVVLAGFAVMLAAEGIVRAARRAGAR